MKRKFIIVTAVYMNLNLRPLPLAIQYQFQVSTLFLFSMFYKHIPTLEFNITTQINFLLFFSCFLNPYPGNLSSFCQILVLLDLYLRYKGQAKPLRSSRYLWYLTLACQPSTVFLKHQEILSFDLIL